MSMDYTQEKLWQAVDSLISSGPIQTRLFYAGQVLIRLTVSTDTAAFPGHPDLHARFEAIIKRLSSAPDPGGREGTLMTSTRALTDEQGAEIAKEIFSLFCRATDLADIPVGFDPRS